MGPLRPQTTILSPSCRIPFDRTTSVVVPRPSITLTSSTVTPAPTSASAGRSSSTV
ncbi:hypothetical protein BDP27DRAFT_1546594 [Rhodocollybia butyracea]|uniref:Uncharacterized protein n=1 Tax=Rhodocollybia butyracea TaxID=206335 RepID=A0A9P5PIM2_9AGAR|nr:hypothetical protein BDP27DRAFT_1546594 [Rhodocollybia butyracea]